MSMRCAHVLPPLLIGLAAPLAQTVRIVDASIGGPGALQAAVNLSTAGDVLRVLPGTYSRTTVGRGLHLLAEPRATCEQLAVQGIPAGETLTVVGFDLVGVPGTDNRQTDAPLWISMCAGDVVLSSSTCRGRQDRARDNPFLLQRTPAIWVDHAELHLEGCDVRGVAGGPSSTGQCGSSGAFRYFLPGPAIQLATARLTVARSVLMGGNGSSTISTFCTITCMTGSPGSPAAILDTSVAMLANATLTGGNGGDGLTPCTGSFGSCPSGQRAGDGAPALVLTGSAVVLAGATVLRAGLAGNSACPAPAPAAGAGGALSQVFLDPGVTVVPAPGGNAFEPGLSSTVRALPALDGLTPRVAIATPAAWLHRDRPGAYAFVVLAVAPSRWLPHPTVLGGFDLDPIAGLMFGPLVVPGSGQVPFGFGVPNDPILRGACLFLQTLGIDASLLPAATALTGLFVDF